MGAYYLPKVSPGELGKVWTVLLLHLEEWLMHSKCSVHASYSLAFHLARQSPPDKQILEEPGFKSWLHSQFQLPQRAAGRQGDGSSTQAPSTHSGD